MLQKGDKAAEISLPDQDGVIHTLSDLAGKWVLVYFYPQDETSGCTVEACGIRDNLPQFSELGLTVLGISPDSVESHKNFADHHTLSFTLLSDEGKAALSAYGVLEEGRVMRTSFLINPEGVIEKVYEKVVPENHAEEVLKDVQDMKK